MADEGPLAPNQFTFAALFRGLSWRRATSGGPEAQAAMCARNASDVKLLWRQMLKIAEKNPQFEFDSHLITPAISALTSGSPSDQLFAFDIVRDYLGLTKPGETPQPPRVQLSTHLLGEVLYLCNSSQKYRLGVHFFRQVVDHPDNRAIITHRHVETVIRLFAGMSMMGSDEASAQALETLEWLLQEEASARNAVELRPTILTFSLVLNVCWRNGDWASATRTFELMTGYNPDDFADGSRVKEPEMQKRSPGRNIKLDTPAMAHIAHTALASQELANMRQCLRIIDHIGAERLLHRPKALVDQSKSSQFMNDLEYYLAKLAKDLMEIVDEVVAKEPEMCSEEERERWKKIKSQAKECRRYARPTRTPHTEESPLGSQRGLDATASAVDQEFSVRRTLRPSRLCMVHAYLVRRFHVTVKYPSNLQSSTRGTHATDIGRSCISDTGRSPEMGLENAGDGGTNASSESAIDTGWYAPPGESPLIRPTVDMVFIGIGATRPGALRARVLPRALRRKKYTAPATTSRMSTSALNAMSASTAGMKWLTRSRDVMRSLESATVVEPAPEVVVLAALGLVGIDQGEQFDVWVAHLAR
ncbi:hypothetical protein IEO21_00941 [Rhodonia placenta]|uniref:Uncharacterized protein n=1 Tax=Rhodonia placenta TaxID=104341 RepID=A0A8H7PAF5_9APHY|nr:hypothetical protein IEO21_00941 [Postia placenta]